MMLLDVFNLLIELGEKILNKPDEPIEYLDQHLKDLFTNKELADHIKKVMYPHADALKVPDSEAQKRLKQIIIYFYFIAEFEKYLEERAVGVREHKRQLLIAIAILDALLTHQAMIAQFWETLSDQYIQYLADRIKMLEIMISLIPLYQKQAALQQQIAVLDRRIKELDGEILRAEHFLNTRYGELIKLSQARLDAVAKVTEDAMHDHLGVLALGTENLSLLVAEKRTQLINAERELDNYLKTDPHNLAGKRDSYESSVKKAGAELDQVTKVLDKYESRLQELHEKRESILNEVNQLKEKALSAKNLEEKKAISEQLLNDKIPELANFTRELPAEAKSLLSTVYDDLKGLAGVDTSMPEKISTQLKDFSPQLIKAERTKSEEINDKQTRISKKTEELDTFKAERAEVITQKIAKEKEKSELDRQIQEDQNKLLKLAHGEFDLSKFKKDCLTAKPSTSRQLYIGDDAKPPEPAPRNNSPKL